MTKFLLIISCLLFCSACNIVPQSSSTRLLYTIEYRDISKDQITEHRVFDNGLVNKTILHDTSNDAHLFKSEFYKLKAKELKKAIQYQKDLQKLDYNNDFPWKKDFYARGNIVKISFPDKVKPQYILDPKSAKQELLLERVFYYYGVTSPPNPLLIL